MTVSMPLTGTVTDFGLADVLQLVARGGRSGRLRMEQGADVVDVHVDAATVIEAHTERATEGELGSRLVQAGRLSEEDLGRALAERARTGRDIGTILTQAGAVDPDVVRHHATLQRWDMLMAPFVWERGHYRFEDAEITVVDGWAESIPVDLVLMKGLRLIEEWPAARVTIPSRSWIIARRLPLPARSTETDPFGTLTETPELIDEELGDEARMIHDLAAPGERVARILGCSPLDRFETTLTLALLAKLRYLVVTPP